MNSRASYLIALLVISCVDSDKKSDHAESIFMFKPDSTALKLNNRAVLLMSDAAHTYDTLKSALYDSAITYLNEAIEIDSLYLLAYTNKAQALQRKGSLKEALEVLNQVEAIKPDFAEVIMGQAFILEKMSKMELADQKYRQALKAFEKRLEDDPKNDKVQSDIAFLYIFLEDKNAALDEIRNLILENPESEQLKMMEGLIKNFDRKKFIEEY
jgi:tetratricopeptide (TPR) repeat protein